MFCERDQSVQAEVLLCLEYMAMSILFGIRNLHVPELPLAQFGGANAAVLRPFLCISCKLFVSNWQLL